MDTYEKAARIDTLENEFLKEMIDYTGYGSRGTINMVVSLLVTLKERIQRGDKIKLEKTGDFLTLESFQGSFFRLKIPRRAWTWSIPAPKKINCFAGSPISTKNIPYWN